MSKKWFKDNIPINNTVSSDSTLKFQSETKTNQDGPARRHPMRRPLGAADLLTVSRAAANLDISHLKAGKPSVNNIPFVTFKHSQQQVCFPKLSSKFAY